MHSNRMRTASSLPYRGLYDRDPHGQRPPPHGQRPPGQRPPWTETPHGQRTPVDRDPPGQRPPGQRPSMGRDLPWTEVPRTDNMWFHSSRMHTACSLLYRGSSDRDTWIPGQRPPGQRPRPPCGQTDTCENITFANFVCGR